MFRVIDDGLKSFTGCLLYCSDLSPAVCQFNNDWPRTQTSASLQRLWLSLCGHIKKGNGVSHLAIYGISCPIFSTGFAEKIWWILNVYIAENHQIHTKKHGAKTVLYSMYVYVWPLKTNWWTWFWFWWPFYQKTFTVAAGSIFTRKNIP